jgi:hypothetical protein
MALIAKSNFIANGVDKKAGQEITSEDQQKLKDVLPSLQSQGLVVEGEVNQQQQDQQQQQNAVSGVGNFEEQPQNTDPDTQTQHLSKKKK